MASSHKLLNYEMKIAGQESRTCHHGEQEYGHRLFSSWNLKDRTDSMGRLKCLASL